MSGTWELFDLTPRKACMESPPKACMESWLSTVQVEREQSTLYTKHNFKRKNLLPCPNPQKKTGSSLHSMTRFFIGCTENSISKIGRHYFDLE
jgi:hypothetical protein